MSRNETCQHGIDILDDCKKCDDLPFCQRIYDGDKNSCCFNLGYDKVKRCVYCGQLPKQPTIEVVS